ncbi:unnamed protein product, partial [Protopolystoma xenopodis]
TCQPVRLNRKAAEQRGECFQPDRPITTALGGTRSRVLSCTALTTAQRGQSGSQTHRQEPTSRACHAGQRRSCGRQPVVSPDSVAAVGVSVGGTHRHPLPPALLLACHTCMSPSRPPLPHPPSSPVSRLRPYCQSPSSSTECNHKLVPSSHQKPCQQRRTNSALVRMSVPLQAWTAHPSRGSLRNPTQSIPRVDCRSREVTSVKAPANVVSLVSTGQQPNSQTPEQPNSQTAEQAEKRTTQQMEEWTSDESVNRSAQGRTAKSAVGNRGQHVSVE